MLENGVNMIYTTNERNFERFEEIEAVNPLRRRANERNN